MKKFHPICRALCNGAVIGVGLVAIVDAQEEDLVGTWSCSFSHEDAQIGARVNAEFEQTYQADGTYERAGEVRVEVPLLEIDMSVAMVEAGTWRLMDETVLSESATELEFSSVDEAPSEVEQMMVQEMQDEAQVTAASEQSVEIKALTATTMQFEDDDGVLSTCEKA